MSRPRPRQRAEKYPSWAVVDRDVEWRGVFIPCIRDNGGRHLCPACEMMSYASYSKYKLKLMLMLILMLHSRDEMAMMMMDPNVCLREYGCISTSPR